MAKARLRDIIGTLLRLAEVTALCLSGAIAAAGVWEGTPGIAVAVALPAILFMPSVRRGRSVLGMLVWWGVAFIIVFVTEGAMCGWPVAVFYPRRVTILVPMTFALAAVVPLAFVRALGRRWWLAAAWGITMVALSAVACLVGRYGREGGGIRFANRVLSELGTRKLVIGDGITDDFFRAVKPEGVRFVSCTSIADREFLISFFAGDAAVTNRALFVSNYHWLPEMEIALIELGLMRVDRPKPKAEWLVAEAVKGLRVLTERLEQIPAAERKASAEAARASIRRAWAGGLRDIRFSAGVLALDVWLGDRAAAETDALTALTLDRDDVAANAMLGSLRLEDGKLELAERYLRKGVSGGGIGACNDLAVLLVKTDRASEAEAWARKAVQKAPKDWNLHETLVQILIALGRTDEARRELAETERLAKAGGQLERAKERLALHRERLAWIKAR